MTAGIAILVAFVVFIILLLAGKYIHTALLVTGLVGVILFQGTEIVPGMIAPLPYERVASYSLSTIPMFILMAQFVLLSGAVNDLFYLVNRVAGQRKVVLGSLTTVAGGMLGAVSGSGNASSAALAQVAIPELNRAGYKKEYSGAVVAMSGALSSVVPPSIGLIIYGVATETSIGDLFLAAFIPAVLTITVVVVTIAFTSRMGTAPVEAAVAESEIDRHRPTVGRLILSMLILAFIVVVVFGGIYLGFITPTEAGAVGAFAAFLTALALRVVNWEFLKKAFAQTVIITAMVMLIMIGAQVFSRFISLSMIPRRLTELLEPIMGQPVLVLIIISIVLFVMFMFIEGAAVILMIIPVVLPILIELNVDLVWFGIFMGVIGTVGLVTPPVGLTVYTVSGVTGINPLGIFRYTMIFALMVAVFVCGLMLIFPELGTMFVTR